MKRFRPDGWKQEELKVYWNVQQLEKLCQVEDCSLHDPSDVDAVDNLRRFPVHERNHEGKIDFIHMGIERAVFTVPEDAQIILLNFAVSVLLSDLPSLIVIFAE